MDELKEILRENSAQLRRLIEAVATLTAHQQNLQNRLDKIETTVDEHHEHYLRQDGREFVTDGIRSFIATHWFPLLLCIGFLIDAYLSHRGAK